MAPSHSSSQYDLALVAAFAAAIRLLVVVLTATLANVSAPHDSSASLDPSLVAVPGYADVLVQKALSPLGHWDGVFFLHIAQHGYTYEMFHAFFPGLPLAMRAVSYIALPFLSPLGLTKRSALLVCGAIIT
jgi:phosphatidylinositol glycan class V